MKNKDDDALIGLRIKQVRKHLNMSQEEFAYILNIKQRTLSYMESGNRGVLCSMVRKIREKFNINSMWLIYEEGEMLENTKKNEPFILEEGI